MAYGEDMSVPPFEPAQPDVPETSGKVTLATPLWSSDAVALRVNEPEPAGLNQSVFADELQYWSPAPATSVGVAFETVGAVLSGVTVKLAVPVSRRCR